jgi:hypothetical protein
LRERRVVWLGPREGPRAQGGDQRVARARLGEPRGLALRHAMYLYPRPGHRCPNCMR